VQEVIVIVADLFEGIFMTRCTIGLDMADDYWAHSLLAPSMGLTFDRKGLKVGLKRLPDMYPRILENVIAVLCERLVEANRKIGDS